jgi:hypothetical protein
VLLTSSLDGVRPVSALDGRELSESRTIAKWLAARIEETGASSLELMAPDGLARAE